jgi:hypothetical protein
MLRFEDLNFIKLRLAFLKMLERTILLLINVRKDDIIITFKC